MNLRRSADYYFAYGTNMDPRVMGRHCPGIAAIGAAVLPGRRFIINSQGYATMVSDAGAAVHGVLWPLNPECERRMDSYEGMDEGLYCKQIARVFFQGCAVQALIYLAADETPGRAGRVYMERILHGARCHGLPADYMNFLRTFRTD